jgi:two-component system, OmpR family, sensor histidine kinase ChvG
MAEDAAESRPHRLFWTRSVSLTARILAVNVVALGLLAGSLFYIDSYRNQLIAERFARASAEAQIVADALAISSRSKRRILLTRLGQEQKMRLRLFDRRGNLIADSFTLAEPSWKFVDPDKQTVLQNAARALDTGMDFIVRNPPLDAYVEPKATGASAWPEIAEARSVKGITIRQRLAPDRTPVITAAIPVGNRGDMLLTTRNARDITRLVRDARQTLAIIIGTALAVSVLLSLFLARTIVQPLRALVRATVRVRLGRDRTVEVPRLPERGDEIGLLARSFSDMTGALRQRMDAVDAFAADVAHEIKNPLASLRSALETLEKVDDPALRSQLTGIAAHDVRRIDRLVTEIAEASRIDAELSRTTFETVDMLRLVNALVAERDNRGVNGDNPVSVTRHGSEPCLVRGDPPRLQRMLENLLDNAVSFSASQSPIDVDLRLEDGMVSVAVSDCGPGIPPEAREKVFVRFHSLRPISEDFGSHSGLGLAIARTIAEAHDGRLIALDRADGAQGARLLAEIPAAVS